MKQRAMWMGLVSLVAISVACGGLADLGVEPDANVGDEQSDPLQVEPTEGSTIDEPAPEVGKQLWKFRGGPGPLLVPGGPFRALDDFGQNRDVLVGHLLAERFPSPRSFHGQQTPTVHSLRQHRGGLHDTFRVHLTLSFSAPESRGTRVLDPRAGAHAPESPSTAEGSVRPGDSPRRDG